MTIEYTQTELLHEDDFADLAAWHHEGAGELAHAPRGGLRLHCHGSRQGGAGCMAFFRPDLPDGIAIEYDVTMRSHGGLIINYLAIRGRHGEDLIADRDKLPARAGVMRDYWGLDAGLQSYHVSFSRFNDKGEHTGTSNWRRNPGCFLVGHGNDLVTEINREFHIRITKHLGQLQFFVDGQLAHAVSDWRDQPLPIPDIGKFGFRLIGSDVMADVRHLRIWKLDPGEQQYCFSDGQAIQQGKLNEQ